MEYDYWEEDEAPVEFPIDQTVDLYEILGLHYEATTTEVKAAYRKLSQELHPDKNTDADEATIKKNAEKFKEIIHAYGILSDPKLLDLYLGLRKGYLTMGQKETPRNSVCPCGSGKKYKKCCIK